MLPQKKILVVEDNLLNREMLVDILADYYLVLEAGNGQEALEILKEHQDDIALILLDIVMPVKDGIDATREILAIDPHATVIIVSSVGTQMQLKKAIEAGAKDFIQKPIEMDQLRTLIQTHLGGQ